MELHMASKHYNHFSAIVGGTKTATVNGAANEFSDCHSVSYAIELTTITTLTAGDTFTFKVQEYIDDTTWTDTNAKNMVFYKEVEGGPKETWDGVFNDTTTVGSFTVDWSPHQIGFKKIRLVATAASSPSVVFGASLIKLNLFQR